MYAHLFLFSHDMYYDENILKNEYNKDQCAQAWSFKGFCRWRGGTD